MIHKNRKMAIPLLAALFAVMLFTTALPAPAYADQPSEVKEIEELKSLVERAGSGDVVRLECDYRADLPEEGWIPVQRGKEITIAEGKDITIDLNGHTIDRNLYNSTYDIDSAVEGIFHVDKKGTLTITDSSNGKGIIRGGQQWTFYSDGNELSLIDVGGAFTVAEGGTLNIKGGTIKECSAVAGAVLLNKDATFNFEGGTITGTEGYSGTVVISGDNAAFNMSGGTIEKNKVGGAKEKNTEPGNAVVYLENGSFNMSGGSITDNDGQLTYTSSPSEPASAVRIGGSGSFSVSGAPVIDGNGFYDNGALEKERNVYLAEGQKINIAEDLAEDAAIGVTIADRPEEGNKRAITSGLNGMGSITSFSSDSANYLVEDSGGEAAFTDAVAVETIGIAPPALELETGCEEVLAADIAPENATYKDVRWKSDDPGVAKVDEGKVTGIAVGSTVIRAYSSNKLEATCEVTVIEHRHDWQEATCTESKKCSKCGATEGEALGHEWGTPTYEWTNDNRSVTATRVCIRDANHIETETATATSEEITPATCTENGEAKFTVTFENEAFETQTKKADIAVLGHDWDEGKVTKEATTSQDGVKTYTCKTCNATKTEVIPMPGHKGKEGTAAPAVTDGQTATVGGNTYKVTSASAKTVAFTKAKKSKKSATVPATVTVNGVKLNVTSIAPKAFKGTKVKTLTVKSKKLTKKSVKGSLKGSKVKTVKVKVGKKKENKNYVKKYKKIFTKKNAGKKVKVK